MRGGGKMKKGIGKRSKGRMSRPRRVGKWSETVRKCRHEEAYSRLPAGELLRTVVGEMVPTALL